MSCRWRNLTNMCNASDQAEIAWHMECYHHETRTRTVTTGSGSNRHTRTETYTVKVTTWRGDKSFEYASCEEVSSPQQLDNIEAFKQTRIKFSKQFVMTDSATRAAFEGQRDEFVAANRYRDREYSLTESFEIAGFEKALMASTTEEKPFFLQCHWYVLAVLLLLELPFSLMIKMQSRRMDYAYVKKLGIW
ncbi:transmembrane protein 151B-like isoform X2 [Paramacrobiotus metropolitanus]|uniref:transmembrane protein 151B-like isoform X2 n=1 Tax=Paramacrobiotus metropolitanus TaxID=2943436 RepID=UPI002445A5CC|nr:transmembrane protein 151B-like isoform X2 [Paramacrobiotus metropolitanus]